MTAIQETQTVTLVIPGDPPPSTNQLLRMHWAEQGRTLTAWATAAWAKWHNAGRIEFARPEVTIRLYFGVSRRRDRDNYTAACKGILDGLSEHAWTDDNADVIDLRPVEIAVDKHNPRVEITITERGAA